MLRDTPAFSGFAVDDITAAIGFYRDKLGLNVSDVNDMGIITITLTGGADIIVYPKDDHVPATYTILNFAVEDIDVTADKLKAAGITLENYDVGEMKADEKGIYRGEGPDIAWFRDPAGNVLSILHEN
jgi:predicted enzyme related to lactoylglutathione lyase